MFSFIELSISENTTYIDIEIQLFVCTFYVAVVIVRKKNELIYVCMFTENSIGNSIVTSVICHIYPFKVTPIMFKYSSSHVGSSDDNVLLVQ